MIKTEIITINGIEYLRTFSTLGYMIERDGVQYTDAVDLANSKHKYVETNIKNNNISEIEEKAEAYDILMGGAC